MRRFLAASLILLLILSGCSGRKPNRQTTTSLPTTSQGTPINNAINTSEVTMISTPDSLCFSEIGYDSDEDILFVTFRESGASYAYYDVPSSVWKKLKNASSMGSYFNSSIKGEYYCEKLG